jgi:hypothetical protein
MAIEAKNTADAIPIVTINWLVNENAKGNNPTTFPIMINKNKAVTYGKIRTLLFPKLDFVISPEKKNNFSIITWNFVGTISLFEVPSQRAPHTIPTTSIMNTDEFVIERSIPKTSIEIIFLTSNDSIGS